MTGHFLVLYPMSPDWAPESPAMLRGAIEAIGFLGAERSPGVHSTGPGYLDLITYLGCSPQVALGDNEAATFIRISGIFEVPQFLRGGNLKSPRCPQCRKSLEKPSVMQSANAMLQCPHCGHAGQLHTFDWRRSAACARLFIEISNVFESEALPGETLAACLQQASGEAWDYCYVRKAG
jgi:hypothetical protein